MSRNKKETTQEDRRVQRTHQLLREALLALIVEKGYEAVSVQDITERANIGRATFYLHYPDKEHLALACVQQSMLQLTTELDAIPQPEGEDSWLQTAGLLVHHTFRYIGEHYELYRSLLSNKSSYPVVAQIESGVVTMIQRHLELYLDRQTLPLPLSLLASHLAGSLMAMIKWWLENDRPLSVDEMALWHLQLVGQGLLPLLPPPAGA